MPDLVDQRWSEHVRELRAALRTGEWAAARERAEALESAYQADGLPADLRALWEQHRVAVNQAITQGEEASAAGTVLGDAVETRAAWEEKLDSLRAALTHIPYALRRQVSIAADLARELDTAMSAGALPEDLATVWQQHRRQMVEAGKAARAFADQWDNDYPALRGRKE